MNPLEIEIIERLVSKSSLDEAEKTVALSSIQGCDFERLDGGSYLIVRARRKGEAETTFYPRVVYGSYQDADYVTVAVSVLLGPHGKFAELDIHRVDDSNIRSFPKSADEVHLEGTQIG